MPIAQNWLLLLSYEGTYYHGWQVQPDCPTIANTIEQALKRLTGENIRIHGSGRTDSGVHALNYTANFKTSSRPNSSMPLFFNKLSFRVAEDFSVTFFDVVVLVEVFLLVANFKKLFESSY